MTLQELKDTLQESLNSIEPLISGNPYAKVVEARIEENTLELAMFYEGDMEECVSTLNHIEQWERLPENWSGINRWIKHIKYRNIQMRNYFFKRPGYCIKCQEPVTEYYDGKPTTVDPSGTYCRRCWECQK